MIVFIPPVMMATFLILMASGWQSEIDQGADQQALADALLTHHQFSIQGLPQFTGPTGLVTTHAHTLLASEVDFRSEVFQIASNSFMVTFPTNIGPSTGYDIDELGRVVSFIERRIVPIPTREVGTFTMGGGLPGSVQGFVSGVFPVHGTTVSIPDGVPVIYEAL